MDGRKLLYRNGDCSDDGANSNLSDLNHSQNRDPLFLSASSSSSPFIGSSSMVSFEDVQQRKRSKRYLMNVYDDQENVEEDLEEYFHQPEKKRRLGLEQVHFLEKSFEVENKLEPDRKIQLAKELGLEPRQVTIWFQNRRARWKIKQLDRDYEALQSSYNNLDAEYESLLREKNRLKDEITFLTDKLLLKQNKKESSEVSKLNKTSEESLIIEPVFNDQVSKCLVGSCKQDAVTHAKTNIVDSNSTQYVERVHSSILEAGDSSYIFELESIQDMEEDKSNTSIFPQYSFPKLKDLMDCSDPPTSSCNFGFSVEDHPFWSWSY